MKKSIISLALTLCLAAGFAAMPVTAHAASNGKAIQPGTACVEDGDHLYFGIKDSEAIQWRVLDADHTNTGDPGMFLLSDGPLGRTYFKEDGSSNSWQGSDAQAWCKNNFSAIFSLAEQGSVLSVSKEDDPFTLYKMGESHLIDERLFFLSAQEAATYPGVNVIYFYWWLRSPSESFADCVGVVADIGEVYRGLVYFDHSARPAFNLNLNSVLFTSAAVGGKASSGAVSAIPAYGGNEWKVTLLDGSRSGFSAKTIAKSGNVLSVDYSGAGDGMISAMIADSSGAYTHYAQLVQSQGSGTVSVDLGGIDMSGKTLYIFNEQLNGDKKTDLASPLVKVELTLANPYGVPSTGSERQTGLMLTLAVLSGSVLFFSLRRRKEA